MIKTDHESLKHLLEQKISTPMQQKGMLKLMGLNYSIQYKKGRENAAADALSRRGETEGESLAITAAIPTWVEEVVESYSGDKHCEKIINELILQATTQGEYSFGHGLLRHKDKLYIGESGPLRKRILDQMHNSALGGHSGIQNTYRRVKQHFFLARVKEGSR